MMATDEGGNHLDHQALLDHCKQFILAGHETTATLVCWTLYALHDNKDVEEKCRKEIETVLGDKQYPSAADLDEMRYLTMTIKETLRHYSPVAMVVRKCEKDDQICGYDVPGGTRIIVSPYVLHHHPNYWEDPDKYAVCVYDQ